MESKFNSFNKTIQNKYYIHFDTNKLPLDFNKWVKLDNNLLEYKKYGITLEYDNKYTNNNYLFLNKYNSVVINSKKDFNLETGGCMYTFEKGIKYLPIFPQYHSIDIQMNNDIEIYVEPQIYNHNEIEKNKFNYYDSNLKNELTLLLENFKYMYGNLNIISEDYKDMNLVVDNGCSGTVPKVSNKNIDVDEFYFDLETFGFENLINPIDKYVQFDFIKIFKFNSQNSVE